MFTLGFVLVLLALLLHALLTGFEPFQGWFVAGVLVAAAAAEAVDFWLSLRFTRRYGGSTRSAWAAVAGGIVGALVGVPLPVVGSVIGAFLGAFAGAALAEWLQHRRGRESVRAGWGAVLGRATSAAMKVALGVVIVLLAAWQVTAWWLRSAS